MQLLLQKFQNLNAIIIMKIIANTQNIMGIILHIRIETWELSLLTKGFTQILLEYAQIVVESVFSRI